MQMEQVRTCRGDPVERSGLRCCSSPLRWSLLSRCSDWNMSPCPLLLCSKASCPALPPLLVGIALLHAYKDRHICFEVAVCRETLSCWLVDQLVRRHTVPGPGGS